MRGGIPGFRARRWVVEGHIWLNRLGRLLIRWEKKIRKLPYYPTFSLRIDNIQISRTFG